MANNTKLSDLIRDVFNVDGRPLRRRLPQIKFEQPRRVRREVQKTTKKLFGNVDSIPKLQPLKARSDLASFDDFVGNERTKKQLQIISNSSKIQNKPLTHLGLFGPAGCGKTTLADLTARLVGASFFYINATSVRSPLQFGEYIRSTKPFNYSLVLIDEAHGLSREIQDSMLSLLEFPAILSIPRKNGPPDTEEFNSWLSFILATTHPGALSEALNSRLEPIKLANYSEKDYREMAIRLFHKSKMGLEDTRVLCTIAKRCRSARDLKRQVNRIIDTTLASGKKYVDEGIVEETYDLLGIDNLGLSVDDRRVIMALSDGPMSCSSISNTLHISREEFQNNIEPFLLRKSFLKVSSHGRELTEMGKKLLRRMRR